MDLRPRFSRVPWWLLDSDLRPQSDGALDRNCRTDDGEAQRHFGLSVEKQYSEGLLGFIAIRCLRIGAQVVPLSMAIPDGTILVPEPDPIVMQSNPRRADDEDDPGDTA